MKRNFQRSKTHATRNKNARKPQGALRSRSLRLESLESREMLSVTTTEYAEITEAYSDFNLPSYDDCNIIEIEADSISLDSLKSAIEAAKSADDSLIVVRTTSSNNTITFTDSTDTLDFSDYTGSITLVGYGAKALTIKGASLTGVITVDSASLNLGNLTLTGGTADAGGAIYSVNSTLTVASTTISSSSATQYGGGVYVDGGEATFIDTKFTSNTSATAGAIYVTNGALNVEGATFMMNRSTGDAGAVYTVDSDVNFSSSAFSFNSAAGGGAMFLSGGEVVLNQTNFTGNSSTASSGGAIANESNLTLINNIFLSNKAATSKGGAIYTLDALTMTDTLFMSNSAVDGGAIYADVEASDDEVGVAIATGNFQLNTATGNGGALNLAGDTVATITCSQLARNTSSANGGAIYAETSLTVDSSYIAANTAENGAGLYTNGAVTLVNDTIVDNTATSTGGAWYNLSGELQIYNSILLGNGATPYVNQGTTTGAYNMLETESELADLTDTIVYDSSADLFTARDSRDYTLVEGSQAINVGSNSYVISETDLPGNKRITKSTVDLGAYEYQFDDDPIEVESVSIDGSLTIGSTLTATVTPASATVTWQWYRADFQDANEWTAIDNATEDEYVLTSDDYGYYVKVVATGYDEYTGEVEAITDSVVTPTLSTPENLTVTATTAYTVSLD